MNSRLREIAWLFIVVAGLAAGTFGQSVPEPAWGPSSPRPTETETEKAVFPRGRQETSNPWSGDDPQNCVGRPLLKHLAEDQVKFWTAPLRINKKHALPGLSFLGLTGGLIAGDHWLSQQVPDHPAQLQRSQNFSSYGVYSLLGASGGSYLLGLAAGNEHMRETGFLAGEAFANSTAVAYALQRITQRERPLEGSGQGRFFTSGGSFPSIHAAAAWSLASVLAHEYPGPLTRILAYGLASGVTVTRVTGQKHFPSDVVVGSVLGWYLGRQIYRKRHNPELGGTSWGNALNTVEHQPPEPDERIARDPRDMGSPYVPLDSWVYPAMDRLAALGYIDATFAGMKPWTRIECQRLIEQAGERLEGSEAGGPDLVGLQIRLKQEFAYELGLFEGGRNWQAKLESVYIRGVSISGVALADSYHFGQTVSNDFGRPFERGMNGQAGAAFRAQAGPFAVYVRAEYQHAPSAPPPSDGVRNLIALKDDVPLPPAIGIPAVNRARLLDTYVTLNLSPFQLPNWQVSVGRKSRSWGPGPGGSLLLSNNAESFDMVEVENTEPIHLPLFLKGLGPVRINQFLGRLGGRTDHPNPWLYGQKISFKPLPCLEIGYGRMTTIGGRGGDPFTFQNFGLSLLGQVSQRLRSVPGDSSNEMDWTLYVPKVRNYIVVYGEVYAEDDFVAWVNPSAYPFRPGIYITRIPGIPKLDFHLEAANTETPGWHTSTGGNAGQFIYFNGTYHQSDTNHGFLLGNPVGRMGHTLQGWLTYWGSPRHTVQFSYKNSFVDPAFIPGGGAWQDYAVEHEVERRSGLYLRTRMQYEHISHYPLLFSGPRNNVTTTVELGSRLRLSR